jgi:hypothetical protein
MTSLVPKRAKFNYNGRPIIEYLPRGVAEFIGVCSISGASVVIMATITEHGAQSGDYVILGRGCCERNRWNRA